MYKKTEVLILILGTVEFRHKKQTLTLKRKITMNEFIPNNRALKYINQNLTELTGEIGQTKIIACDFNAFRKLITRQNLLRYRKFEHHSHFDLTNIYF